MGDHEHRAVEPQQDLGELAARDGVEVCRGLVEHEDLGVAREDGGQGGAAALPAREVHRRPVGELRHADGLERLLDPQRQLRLGDPEVGRPERDVVGDGRHEQLVVGVLEDDADAPADLLDVLAGDLHPADPHGARARPVHAIEVQHERRLARPVRPEQRDPLAALDAQVHAEEGLVAVGVRERQPRDLEGRDRHQAQYPDIASRRRGDGRHEGHRPRRRRRGRRGERRHRARVAAGEHREVHALAALVGAQEQRPDRPHRRPELPDEARVVAAGHTREAHPPGLGGDDLEVAQHQRRDHTDHRRHPQPREPGDEVAQRGGGRERHRDEHAERALDQDVPAGEQAVDGQGHPHPLDPRARRRRTAAARRARRTVPR